MNEKIVNEVLKRLDLLGAQIQAGGLKLGEEGIKYIVYENIGYLIGMVFLFLGFIATAYAAFYFAKRGDWRYGGPNDFKSGTSAVCAIVSLVLLGIMLGSLFALPRIIATLNAPAWALVMKLMGK